LQAAQLHSANGIIKMLWRGVQGSRFKAWDVRREKILQAIRRNTKPLLSFSADLNDHHFIFIFIFIYIFLFYFILFYLILDYFTEHLIDFIYWTSVFAIVF
jgi:hypothetical protein